MVQTDHIYFRETTSNDVVNLVPLVDLLGRKTTINQLEQRLNFILETPDQWIWVAEKSDVLLGFIHFAKVCRLSSDPFFEIGLMAVAPSVRKQGIGTQLVGIAWKEAYTANMKLRVRCNTKRIQAQQFYLSQGFKSMKIQEVLVKGPDQPF